MWRPYRDCVPRLTVRPPRWSVAVCARQILKTLRSTGARAQTRRMDRQDGMAWRVAHRCCTTMTVDVVLAVLLYE